MVLPRVSIIRLRILNGMPTGSEMKGTLKSASSLNFVLKDFSVFKVHRGSINVHAGMIIINSIPAPL